MDYDNEVKEKLKAWLIGYIEVYKRLQESPPSLQAFLSKSRNTSSLKFRIILPLHIILYFYSLLCFKIFQRPCQRALSDHLKIYMNHIREKVVMGVSGYELILSICDSLISEYRGEEKSFMKSFQETFSLLTVLFVPYSIFCLFSLDEKNRIWFFGLFLDFLDNKDKFVQAITSGFTPYTVSFLLSMFIILCGFLYCSFKGLESVYIGHILKLYKTHSLFDTICILDGMHQGKIILGMSPSEIQQLEQDLDKKLQIRRTKSTDFIFILDVYSLFLQALPFIALNILVAFLVTLPQNRFAFIDLMFT
jgi:hypothetical protein